MGGGRGGEMFRMSRGEGERRAKRKDGGRKGVRNSAKEWKKELFW